MIIKEFRNAMRYLKEGKGLKEMCEILRKAIDKETKRLEKTNSKMRKKVKAQSRLINEMKVENKNAREDGFNQGIECILRKMNVPESQWNELKADVL